MTHYSYSANIKLEHPREIVNIGMTEPPLIKSMFKLEPMLVELEERGKPSRYFVYVDFFNEKIYSSLFRPVDPYLEEAILKVIAEKKQQNNSANEELLKTVLNKKNQIISERPNAPSN